MERERGDVGDALTVLVTDTELCAVFVTVTVMDTLPDTVVEPDKEGVTVRVAVHEAVEVRLGERV